MIGFLATSLTSRLPEMFGLPPLGLYAAGGLLAELLADRASTDV